MKCTNCGKNDVNFYYESNVNGKITRQQLCSECAQKLGFGTEDIFKRSQAMFDSMFSGFADFFGSRRRALPFGGFGMPTMLLPELLMPGFGRQSDTAEETGAENAVNEQSQAQTAADGEMNVRRQINMLRSQMQDAVNAEEFEKAAELRDKIRELEKDSDK